MERLEFKSFLYNKVVPIFDNFLGFTFKKIVDEAKIKDLIKLFMPYDCGIELIRLGPDYDGGYLIPNDLENIDALFSPGTSDMYEFEKEVSNYGIHVFMADASVDVDVSAYKNLNFLKKFVGISISDDFITLEKWINSSVNSQNSDLILQMDIEGAEYINILTLPESILNRFRIVVIEFHNLRSMIMDEFYNLVKSTILKLLQNHQIVHIHPNNNDHIYNYRGIQIPNVIEVTLLRKDRIKTLKPIASLPHALDYNNTKTFKPMNLPEFWYKS